MVRVKHFLGRLKVALLLSVICGGSKGELVPAEGCCFLEVYICFVGNNQADAAPLESGVQNKTGKIS